MTPQSCDRMPDVRAALSAGQWADDLLAHALDCEACWPIWMTACLADGVRVEISRPLRLDADVVWWKAKLYASRRGSRRALAPIMGAQVIALAGGAVALFPVVTALRAMVTSEPLSSTSIESLGSVLLFAFLLSVARRGVYRRDWRMSR
jgi:hypothetical protein